VLATTRAVGVDDLAVEGCELLSAGSASGAPVEVKVLDFSAGHLSYHRPLARSFEQLQVASCNCPLDSVAIWNCEEDYSARRISAGSIRSARKTAGTVATAATARITAQGRTSMFPSEALT